MDICASQPTLIDYFRHTLVPEEAFFQTILLNADAFVLANDSLRYFDFSKTVDGSPAVLDVSDCQTALRSDAHFARKFDDSENATPLDFLDTKLGSDRQD